jgi:hypothetical protein
MEEGIQEDGARMEMAIVKKIAIWIEATSLESGT